MHRLTLQLILNASVNQTECIITLTFRIHRSALSGCWWRTQGEFITDASGIIFIHLYLPSSSSQSSVLQLCTSTLSPAQHWPPFAGGGLVQVLLRSFIPPPHGTLHSLQSPKSLHPPCTAPGLRPERQLLKWSGNVLYLNTDYVAHISIALLFGLIDWLIDWLTEWLTDWPTDGLAHWLARLLTETSTREHSSFCKEIRNVWCIALLYNCLLSVNHIE